MCSHILEHYKFATISLLATAMSILDNINRNNPKVSLYILLIQNLSMFVIWIGTNPWQRWKISCFRVLHLNLEFKLWDNRQTYCICYDFHSHLVRIRIDIGSSKPEAINVCYDINGFDDTILYLVQVTSKKDIITFGAMAQWLE